MRFAYFAKAVSKRVSKLDTGEDVFEADDMVQLERASARLGVVNGNKKAREVNHWQSDGAS